MSSVSSYPRCAVELSGSRLLLLYSTLLSLAALAAPWLAHAGVSFSLFINAVSLFLSRRLFRWARGTLSRIVWLPGGRWLVVDRGATEHEADALLPGIFVGTRLVALHWRCVCCGRMHRAAVLGDNTDATSMRRMIVRLRATPDDQLFGDSVVEESRSGQ